MQLDSKSPGQLNPIRYFIDDATYGHLLYHRNDFLSIRDDKLL